MIWLYPNNDTFTVFYQKPDLPDLIEFDELPEGFGILRMNDDGELYWETPVEPSPSPPVDIEATPEEIQKQILLNTELLVIYKELGF